MPMTGSGTEAGVARLTAAELARFHGAWFRPNNATLVAVGDVTLAELLPKLERRFGAWGRGEVPQKNIGPVPLPERPTVTVVDRPGSIQSVIFVGNVAPQKANPDELAIEAMNLVLGGNFTSRINMNLREDKHWTYGARTSIGAARGPRPFWASVQVQTDKTRETMRELDGELRGILGARPVTQEEFARTVNSQSLKLPGSWETIGSVAGALSEAVCLGLPDDYYQTLPAQLGRLTRENLCDAAKKVVQAERLSWIVVGDRAKIEAGIRELGFGEIRIVDADGQPVAK
jgi:zinc protease